MIRDERIDIVTVAVKGTCSPRARPGRTGGRQSGLTASAADRPQHHGGGKRLARAARSRIRQSDCKGPLDTEPAAAPRELISSGKNRTSAERQGSLPTTMGLGAGDGFPSNRLPSTRRLPAPNMLTISPRVIHTMPLEALLGPDRRSGARAEDPVRPTVISDGHREKSANSARRTPDQRRPSWATTHSGAVFTVERIAWVVV